MVGRDGDAEKQRHESFGAVEHREMLQRRGRDAGDGDYCDDADENDGDLRFV